MQVKVNADKLQSSMAFPFLAVLRATGGVHIITGQTEQGLYIAIVLSTSVPNIDVGKSVRNWPNDYDPFEGSITLSN